MDSHILTPVPSANDDDADNDDDDGDGDGDNLRHTVIWNVAECHREGRDRRRDRRVDVRDMHTEADGLFAIEHNERGHHTLRLIYETYNSST